MAGVRMTHAVAAILGALSRGFRYGFDIMDATGLPSGTVYPALRRLERRGLVQGRWEEGVDPSVEGRPRRRFYALTAEGRARVAEAEARLNDVRRLLEGRAPAPEGGGGGET